VTPVRAPEKVTVATPVDGLTAPFGMRIIRTPVDGAATAVTVPALLIGEKPGSWMATFVAVPVVMTRMKTPFRAEARRGDRVGSRRSDRRRRAPERDRTDGL
jgi:hypothetical protein